MATYADARSFARNYTDSQHTIYLSAIKSLDRRMTILHSGQPDDSAISLPSRIRFCHMHRSLNGHGAPAPPVHNIFDFCFHFISWFLPRFYYPSDILIQASTFYHVGKFHQTPAAAKR